MPEAYLSSATLISRSNLRNCRHAVDVIFMRCLHSHHNKSKQVGCQGHQSLASHRLKFKRWRPHLSHMSDVARSLSLYISFSLPVHAQSSSSRRLSFTALGVLPVLSRFGALPPDDSLPLGLPSSSLSKATSHLALLAAMWGKGRLGGCKLCAMECGAGDKKQIQGGNRGGFDKHCW